MIGNGAITGCAAMLDLLIFIRAIHFAASTSVAGLVFFLSFVGAPAFRRTDSNATIPAPLQARLAWLGWISLGVAVISGACWLVIQAAQMSDLSLADVFAQGVLWTVLSDTDFGRVWAVRLALVIALAAVSPFSSGSTKSARKNAPALLLAASLVGSLAFAGHAAAGSGTQGTIHLMADILHLIAAAAWVGALIPLAMLFAAANGKHGMPTIGIAVAREATLRFSTLGMTSVGTLLATGVVNSWVLAGSVPALIGTNYGRVLLIKVGLFLGMVSVAAFNRQHLTPLLVQERNAYARERALRQLRVNSLIEVTLGVIIFGVVGVLGITPPGLES